MKSNKKNILYIFHVSFIGGGSLCLLNLIKALDKDVFKPIVLLKALGPLCVELEKAGATVIIESSLNTVPYNKSLYKLSSIKQVIKTLFSIWKVKYWIGRFNPEIVHINTMMMYFYTIPAKKLGKKVIIHAREHWPIDENKFQLKYAQKIIRKNTDLIIAINNTSASVINIPEKTKIIYDWIDFKKRDSFIDFKILFGNDYNKLKVFLFLGGISKIKGLMEITNAFKDNLLGHDTRLLIVGCDSKEISFKGVRGKIKKILHLFKYFSFSDKFKMIAQKNENIVCIPSTIQVKSLIEQSYCTIAYPTIPHAILPIAESIFLGKPVLSANTPEALEYSDDGNGANLFEINNNVDFIKKLTYVYENEKDIYAKAVGSQNTIKNKFSMHKNTEKLNKLYKKLLIC